MINYGQRLRRRKKKLQKQLQLPRQIEQWIHQTPKEYQRSSFYDSIKVLHCDWLTCWCSLESVFGTKVSPRSPQVWKTAVQRWKETIGKEKKIDSFIYSFSCSIKQHVYRDRSLMLLSLPSSKSSYLHRKVMNSIRSFHRSKTVKFDLWVSYCSTIIHNVIVIYSRTKRRLYDEEKKLECLKVSSKKKRGKNFIVRQCRSGLMIHHNLNWWWD